MAVNFVRAISNRLVVEYVLVPRRVNKSEFWVVEGDLIEVVDDVPFVSLSTASRGMAKAIGADMSLSVPLGRYTWTDTLRELRTGAVSKMIDDIAKERDPGYVAGKTKPNLSAIEEYLPKVVTVTLPQFDYGGATFGPLDVKIRVQAKSNKTVAVEMTMAFFNYFVAAMQESQQPDDTDTPRKRCKRDARVSTTTGVVGVRMYGKSHGQKAEPRIGIPYTDEDGITKYKTTVLRDGVEATAVAAKLKDDIVDLLGGTDNEAVGEVPPTDAAATVAGPSQPSVSGIVKDEPSASEVATEPVADVAASSASQAKNWSSIFPSLK
jgi:hypothetical protein